MEKDTAALRLSWCPPPFGCVANCLRRWRKGVWRGPLSRAYRVPLALAEGTQGQGVGVSRTRRAVLPQTRSASSDSPLAP